MTPRERLQHDVSVLLCTALVGAILVVILSIRVHQSASPPPSHPPQAMPQAAAATVAPAAAAVFVPLAQFVESVMSRGIRLSDLTNAQRSVSALDQLFVSFGEYHGVKDAGEIVQKIKDDALAAASKAHAMRGGYATGASANYFCPCGAWSFSGQRGRYTEANARRAFNAHLRNMERLRYVADAPGIVPDV